MNDKGRAHSQSNSPSEESTDLTIFTPQSSTTFSPEVLPSLPGQGQDVPIPSIEAPAFGLLEQPDTSNSGSHTSFNEYENVLETLKGVNLRPLNNGSGHFQFGQVKELSPFTFRNLHNTTPEPTALVALAAEPNLFSGPRSGSGLNSKHNKFASIPGPKQPPAVHTSANIVAALATKHRASSAPTQFTVSNQPSKTAGYDIGKEIAPDKPYFDKDFQDALCTGKSVATNIADVLGTCELARDRQSQVFSMIQTANELSKFDAPSVCKIGIVGDSGVGKSSLINSLLDEPDLARTAGLGAACTSVVTEYQLRKPGQSAKYTIEIDRMTDSEIEEQLQELLWSYRKFHIWDLDKENLTADEQKHLEDKAKLAWDTLKSAFGSRRELTETYLKDTSDGAEGRIQQQLKLWTDSLQWPGDSHQNGWLGSAENVEEYNEKTKQFLAGTLWPFIKVMRVFLSSQVLKSGAILADLPGFHDSNNARVKAAEDYMYQCEEIFVVADITRVGTNKSVEKILEKSLGRNLKDGRPSQGIALDLDVDEVREKFFADSQSENAAKVKLLEKIVEEAENDDEEKGALRRKNDAQAELDYLYMTARNEYIEKLIISTHAKILRPRPLSVFCVSNKAYKYNRPRAKANVLSIKGSGIPLLRQHCHKIPSRAQFRIGHHFLTVSVKSLVQQVQLWLVGGSPETLPNHATVQRLLESLQGDLKMLKEETVFTVQKSRRLDRRSSANIRFVDGTQISRFCANYGSWGRGKILFTEWNLELINPMVCTMSSQWDVYTESSAATLGDLEMRILGLLDGLISQVEDFQGAPIFTESLVTKKDSIKYTFEKIEEFAREQIDLIKRDATQNHHSAYIYELMHPTYIACMKDSVKMHGDGVTLRRLDRLQKAIGTAQNPILFGAIRSRLENDLLLLVADITNTINRKIGDILAQIRSNIEILRGTEAQVLAKNGDFLERLGGVVTEVLKDLEYIGKVAAQVKRKAESDGYC
ncbi:hypothetical protein OIDMADRAFT_149423 [Oidiodendron maius Zn]|uniref:G domain-containing protein n=1 Tax=Oidiodendron maius (strain Zn) TaxID=913774 RepID=A0A0C3C616_OIDMZ|nr:hypothetical protein OIDMADRAFT_149423 [Oidiodendron maius Zn]